MIALGFLIGVVFGGSGSLLWLSLLGKIEPPKLKTREEIRKEVLARHAEIGKNVADAIAARRK